ncbi:hypothetical protein HNY73_022249 [Argiope bruennichi]|uniref:NADP-dependent oxidoreductase domain-containing protein n=1 Tax=Argiope bruennichi TaxID=94029 RepID=A0A8T0E1X1_ARGBR|nr:hypothetical protein HNY73_022249 [Argiope bruennichi]
MSCNLEKAFKRLPTYQEGFHDDLLCDGMTYVPFGKTGLDVSLLGLGGSELALVYGTPEEEDGIQTVIEGIRSGINYVDTAPYYGQGKAEIVLGKVHDVEFAKDTDIIVNETLPALEKVKEMGKIKFIGITGYSLSKLNKKLLEANLSSLKVGLSSHENNIKEEILTKYFKKLTVTHWENIEVNRYWGDLKKLNQQW